MVLHEPLSEVAVHNRQYPYGLYPEHPSEGVRLQLLQGSQLPIVEIANRVGFSSSSYFAKCFKEMFGVLPKQYAEDYGKKD